MSSRMGRPKALLPLPSGETFLAYIIRTFGEAGVDDIVIVVGHEAEAVAAAGAGVRQVSDKCQTPRFVFNADFEQGQLSSILAGLRAVDRPGVAGILLTLVDVPLVSAATVRAILARQRLTRAPIVRPTAGGRHGHPVFIDRSLFDALRRANPAEGAKPIVRAYASCDGDLAIDDDGAFLDVDTPAEYERLFVR
jgi:CTP:molybdopterin cytidylyltransferase MocA